MKNTAPELNAKAAPPTQNFRRLKKSDFKHHLFIESYGVKVGITANKAEAIEAVRKILDAYLLDCFTETDAGEATQNFLYRWNPSGIDSFSKNGKKLCGAARREKMLEYFGSEVRRTIAEFAVGRVFIHSGVVSWKGKAIVIPAKSLGGKTSLTAALIKRGALYYSDEYAILDEEGFVHPFPKTLSVRTTIDHRLQIEQPVEAFGGKAATVKAPVGMFLLTQYKPNARWNPKILSPAKGILEILNHTVPIRANPGFVLKVLNHAARAALIVKSNRGEVTKSVDSILDFFEENCF
jgi:hypothetical protein